MLGCDAAERVIAKQGTSDLRTIVRSEGLLVETRLPWHARFDDLFAYPLILVPKDLSSADFRTCVAHCLGHYVLHGGQNQVWLRGYDRIWSWKQEHQAEEFAAWLTIPESDDPELVYGSPEDVAKKYRVTEELARVRLESVTAT